MILNYVVIVFKEKAYSFKRHNSNSIIWSENWISKAATCSAPNEWKSHRKTERHRSSMLGQNQGISWTCFMIFQWTAAVSAKSQSQGSQSGPYYCFWGWAGKGSRLRLETCTRNASDDQGSSLVFILQYLHINSVPIMHPYLNKKMYLCLSYTC